jgi:hypothetical protein
MRRELVLALRAPATWVVLALVALLCGHSTMVAADVFSAASRSADAGALMWRQMDPLLGVVRPALGGLELATVVLLPVMCVRSLATEMERGSFRALSLVVASPSKVVLQKLAVSSLLALLGPALAVLALAGWALAGGSLDVVETATSVGAHALHALLVCAMAVAAAAWMRTHAQAITLALVASLASWAIDASTELAALAWLARAERFSISSHLASADRGVFVLGDLVWLVCACAGAALLACVGARFDRSRKRRMAMAAGVLVLTLVGLLGSGAIGLRRDWTEQRRASLPPAVEAGVRALRHIRITVYLDRDDSRRYDLEHDVLAKLRIARPDLEVSTPYDQRIAPAEAARDGDYGTIVVEVDGSRRVTRSTSRKEIVTLLFESRAVPLPSWEVPPYAGRPSIVEGAGRTILASFLYGLLPGALVIASILVRRRRR